ncbi:HNH endonuclease [Chryseobacterium indoltheticum]|uniref:HNH endonuclease n=1 Tax=Chryseobacterium indoltheticum TaxID=254 RepID=UPI003F49AE0C
MEKYYNSFFQVKIDERGIENNLGRWLSEKMNVRVCPYCNHNYIFTLNVAESKSENKITSKPHFDHYLPKSKYPILSLSLYNLIPSCSVCNKIKDEREFTFYPYDETSKENLKFIIRSEDDYNPSKWVTGEGKIGIDLFHYLSDDKVATLQEDKTTINKQLGLEVIYQEHLEYAEEIVDKVFAYNRSYYDAMIFSYNGLGKTPDQIESIIWSAYLEKVGDRPMSKLTK